MRAILTFHSVDDSASVVSYDAPVFEKLLETLSRKSIAVHDLDTLLSPQAPQGVAITFDDGMKSVYSAALPVLRHYGVPAHLFLTTGVIGRDRPWPEQPAGIPSFEMLNWDQVAALHEGGVRIESHTHTHPDMRLLSEQQMHEECERADALIESRLGRRPRYFAYPFGYHNSAARDYARARYRATVTTELRPLSVREDNAAIPRLDAFYLRSAMGVRYLNSGAMRAYLALRNRLRNLKGSQCRAGQD